MRWPKLPTLVLCFLVLSAPEAFAQGSAQSRRASSITSFGLPPSAKTCVDAVNGRGASRGPAAIAACDTALEAEQLDQEETVNVTFGRGLLRLRAGLYESSLADFEAVLAIDPERVEAMANKGAVLVQLRRFGEAVATLTEALSRGVPDPQKVYFNRGVAREALRDHRGAYEDFRTALDIDPGWATAEAELARFAQVRRDALAQRIREEEEEDARAAATPMGAPAPP